VPFVAPSSSVKLPPQFEINLTLRGPWLPERIAMLRFSLAVLIVISGSPRMAKAADADDAVDLLTYALRCPNELIVNPSPPDVTAGLLKDLYEAMLYPIRYSTHETNRFIGTAKEFRIEQQLITERQKGIGKINSTYSAAFSKLKVKFAPQRGRFFVYVGCSDSEKLAFGSAFGSCMIESIRVNVDSKTEGQTVSGVSFEVCDENTARNAQLAIETLIKLNAAP
jgi:hypothetical protein